MVYFNLSYSFKRKSISSISKKGLRKRLCVLKEFYRKKYNTHSNVVIEIQTNIDTSEDDDRMEEPHFVDQNVPNEDLDITIRDTNIETEIDSILTSYNDTRDHHMLDIPISQFLIRWAVDFNITRTSLNVLLKYLKNIFPDLPNDYRKLLQTPRFTTVIDVYPGIYHHVGIKVNIDAILSNTKIIPDKILLDGNFDGVAFFEDSTIGSFWVALMRIFNIPESEPFTVGIYQGKSKPKPFSNYLRPTVDELKILLNEYSFNGKRIKVVVRSLNLDAPARCSVCATKYFNGYSSCPKCLIVGRFVNGRMTFENTHSNPRTDESFRNRLDPEYHSNDDVCPFEEIGFDMVTRIPIDYLHCCLLGNMRRILKNLFGLKSKKENALYSPIVKAAVSDILLEIEKFQPVEFQRRIRSLDDLAYYKGTEFRTFLLFTGPIVLRNCISIDEYNHFICFHVAITILCSRELHKSQNNIAKQLLNYFSDSYSDIYENDGVVSNIHLQTHLADDALIFGPLDDFSTFWSESYFSKLRNFMSQHKHALQQMSNRIAEYNHAAHIPSIKTNNYHQKIELGKKIDNNYYLQIHYYGVILNTSQKNNHVLTINKDILKIEKFSVDDVGEVYLHGRTVLEKNDVYSQPIKSSLLQIFSCSLNYGDISVVKLCEIERKMFTMMITSEPDKMYAFPLAKFKYTIHEYFTE